MCVKTRKNQHTKKAAHLCTAFLHTLSMGVIFLLLHTCWRMLSGELLQIKENNARLFKIKKREKILFKKIFSHEQRIIPLYIRLFLYCPRGR